MAERVSYGLFDISNQSVRCILCMLHALPVKF